jgi:hypothetical protein
MDGNRPETVSNVTIQLPQLTPELKHAFQVFYQGALNGTEPNAQTFDEAAFSYFDQKYGDAGEIDQFFNGFTPLWNHRLAAGDWGGAAIVWRWALRPALAWESHKNARLHKGTAFYFASMSAILAGDLDAGYLYGHRALEEDRVTHGTCAPLTPSLSLVAMDADNANQAFRSWVVEKARFVEARLATYRQSSGRAFDFGTLRSRLLDRPGFVEPTFLLSYCVARLRRLDTLMPGGLDGDFASQLRLNILFDLTMVTDAILRRVAPSQWQFIDLADALSSVARLTLTKADLGTINGDLKNDFSATVIKILDGGYSLAYGCRNRGAHHLSGGHVISHRFGELRQSLMNMVFLAVECLPT